MSLVPRDARVKLYAHPVLGPGLGLYGTATAVSAGTLTDVQVLGSSAFSFNSFNGQATIWLPNETGLNREKQAGLLYPSGVLGHSMGPGSPWTGAVLTSPATPYEILWGSGRRRILPAHMIEAGRLAMRRVYFRYQAPVGPWKDATGRDNSDFAYGVSEWLASGGSLSVTETEARAQNIFGFKGMLLTNTSGADRYVYHSLGVPVQPGDTWWMAALIKVIEGSGTVSVGLYNAQSALAGSALLGTAMAATGPGSEFELGQQVNPPASCYRMNLRVTIPTGMTVAVDSLPGHRLHDHWLPVADWVKYGYHLGGILETSYGRDLGGGVRLLAGRQPERWRYGIDYELDNNDENQRPGYIQVIPGPGRRSSGNLPAKSLWIDGLRQESDRINFTAESELYYGDEDLFMAAYKAEAANMLEGRDSLGPQGKWQRLMRDELATLDAQRLTKERTTLQVKTPQRHIRTAL